MNRLLLASCLLSLFCGCVSAAGRDARYQGGVVRASGGQPCFAVDNNRETRRSEPLITMIDLYKRVDGRAEKIWDESFTPETGGGETALTRRLHWLSRRRASAPALAEAGLQRNALGGSQVDGETHSRWYHMYFCMVDNGGELRPHQVHGDDWGACGDDVRW